MGFKNYWNYPTNDGGRLTWYQGGKEDGGGGIWFFFTAFKTYLFFIGTLNFRGTTLTLTGR